MPDTFTTTITGIGASGEGITRHDGKVVFVPGALPGETVQVEIIRRGASFDRARLAGVTDPRGRRPTPCAHDHAGGCGGCGLLHATRETQALIKAGIVRDALTRIAGIDGARVKPTLTPGPEFGYRNHARFGVNGDGRLTYVTRADSAPSRDRPSIPIDACAVLHPQLDKLRGMLDGRVAGASEVELRIGTATGESLAILHGMTALPRTIAAEQFPGALAVSRGEQVLPVKGLPQTREVVRGATFRVSARSFFQVNAAGAECLVDCVREAAAVPKGGRVLELFAGVGLFAVAAFDSDTEVIAAEIDHSAAGDFRVNAAGRPRVKLRELDVAELLQDFRSGVDRFDAAVIDPPRAGVGPGPLGRLAQLRIPRLVMVSCDPGSLARDVKTLVANGYELVEATPVDQFPGTAHVETVALLVPKGRASDAQ